MPLEKHDVGRDIGKRVLTEGCMRQADSAKQIGLARDMLTRRGISGIQKETADHKGGDAAFPQEADGLGEEIVVDGEFSQFGKIGIVQRLLAEGGIADYGIQTVKTDLAVLKADIEMLRLWIKILRDG